MLEECRAACFLLLEGCRAEFCCCWMNAVPSAFYCCRDAMPSTAVLLERFRAEYYYFFRDSAPSGAVAGGRPCRVLLLLEGCRAYCWRDALPSTADVGGMMPCPVLLLLAGCRAEYCCCNHTLLKELSPEAFLLSFLIFPIGIFRGFSR